MTTEPAAKADRFAPARSRSIDNLQRLYTFLISLAVTQALRHILNLDSTPRLTDNISDWLIFIIFLATLIPFYHGANRHLDASYVTGERTARDGALMLDFLFLLVEGTIIFALAGFSSNEQVFFAILAFLLLFDALWAFLTHLYTTDNPEIPSPQPPHIFWAIMNTFVALVIVLVVWSNIFPSQLAREVFLAILLVLRTAVDYRIGWRFYYPR